MQPTLLLMIACAKPLPPAVPAQGWQLQPVALRYEEGVAYVEAAVQQAPTDFPRNTPVYVGVTLFRPDGTEVDLAVQTRFADALEEPFFLSAEVSGEIESVVLGLWGEKVEPCYSDRPGCQQFGFVLDKPLASWPPAFYHDFQRQRFLPAEVTLRVFTSRGDIPEVTALGHAALAAVAPWTAPFGATAYLDAVRWSTAIPSPQVRYHRPGDLLLARAAADALRAQGLDVEALLDPSDAQGLDILIPGASPRCLERCDEGALLETCLPACAP